MKKPDLYARVSIGGFFILGVVIGPLMASNYFTDATVTFSRAWDKEKETIFYITDHSDAVKFQQIKDRIDQWWEEHPCIGASCDPPRPQFKVYEAYSIRDTFGLSHSSSTWDGYPIHHWGVVEYKGNYYTIHILIPDTEFDNYLFYGAIISAVGSGVIAGVWIKFGAG